jgi:Tfp pilus assembly protein PilN
MSARVNLLPREIEQRARARRTASWTVAGVAVFAALLLLLYLGKLNALNGARQERDSTQVAVDDRQAELASLEEFARLDREVKARNALLSAAMATEISWARVLNDLALTFPPSSSLLGLNAAAEGAAEAGISGDAAANPNSRAIASMNFEGYSVEQFAPGVERVLIKFSDVDMFFNAYLAEATENEAERPGTVTFTGSLQLNDGARTNRYAQGLPPEVGR